MISQLGQMSVEEFATIHSRQAAAVASGGEASYLLLDVRNPDEWNIGHIAGSQLIPLPDLPHRWQEIKAWRHRPVYTLCHHGVRSQQAALFLLQQGFTRVVNIQAGIDAWSQRVDQTIPRY